MHTQMPIMSAMGMLELLDSLDNVLLKFELSNSLSLLFLSDFSDE